MGKYQHYAALAQLFDYPDTRFVVQSRGVRQVIASKYPDAVDAVDQFLELVPEDDLAKMQELYMRTFDVLAITTLDIGYVLFGDDYKRGELLSNLNREHNACEIDCGGELADHLPNVLRLMTKLTDRELLEELVAEIVAPAIHKMKAEFAAGRIEQKHLAYRKHYKTLLEPPAESVVEATLYQYALHTLDCLLQKDFDVVERIPVNQENSFLSSIGRENDIEGEAHAFY